MRPSTSRRFGKPYGTGGSRSRPWAPSKRLGGDAGRCWRAFACRRKKGRGNPGITSTGRCWTPPMLSFAAALPRQTVIRWTRGTSRGAEAGSDPFPPGRNLWSHASLLPSEADRPGRHVGDLRLYDDGGSLVASSRGCDSSARSRGPSSGGMGGFPPTGSIGWSGSRSQGIPGSREPTAWAPSIGGGTRSSPGNGEGAPCGVPPGGVRGDGRDLDLACAAYAEKAIRQLGWDLSPGASRTGGRYRRGARHRPAATDGCSGTCSTSYGKKAWWSVGARNGAGTGKSPGPDPTGSSKPSGNAIRG